MIVNVLGVPQLSLLEARLLCDIVGVRLGVLRSRAPNFQSFRPRFQVYFGPVRIVYINEADVFNQYLESLIEKPQHHVVLLNLSVSTLKEVGVPIHAEGREPLTTYDLLNLMSSTPVRSLSLEDYTLVKKVDLAREIMTVINKESMLGKLQTSFYRIKQVEDRQKVQALVYAYLSGSIKKLPPLEYPFLNTQLSSDLCKRFREAVKMAKTEGADYAATFSGIDRFELAFVLSRAGYDPNKTS